MPEFLLNAKVKKMLKIHWKKKRGGGINIENPPTSFPRTAFKSSTTGINRHILKAAALTK